MSHNINHCVQQFVPTYVVRSQYLPTNRVVDSNQGTANEWLRNYEEQRRLGRVSTHRPVQFNPNRYVSVRTYECVKLDRPIGPEQFQTEISRVRRY